MASLSSAHGEPVVRSWCACRTMRVAIFALFTFRGSAMKEMRTLLLACSVVLPIAILAAQAPDPSRLGNYPDAWPRHYDDHSGRRYSPRAQIDLTTVKALSL